MLIGEVPMLRDGKGDLVHIHQLSYQVGISKRWLRMAASSGQIPCLVAGNRRLFNVEAVRSALAELAATSYVTTDGGSDPC